MDNLETTLGHLTHTSYGFNNIIRGKKTPTDSVLDLSRNHALEISFNRASISISSHWEIVVVLAIVEGRIVGQPDDAHIPLARNAKTSAAAILLRIKARLFAMGYENHGN